MKYSIFLLLIIILSGCSNGSAESHEKKQDNSRINYQSDAPMPTPTSTMEPMSFEFYQNFFASTQQFTKFYFYYDMGIDQEHPNARNQGLSLNSYTTCVNEYFVNKVLSNCNSLEAYYCDTNSWLFYNYQMPKELAIPLFQLIQQQPEFYFSGEEFGNEESLKIGMDFDFGHRNYVSMSIYIPDQKCGLVGTCKTFCKGWDPGDNPPTELMPVINYIENTILPIMREHPSQLNQ